LQVESTSPSLGRVSLLRKLIHLAMAVVPAVGWWLSYEWALALAGLLVVVSMAIEASRRWWPWINRLLWRLLPTVFRAWEDQGVLGSTWFVVGMMPTLLLFGRDAGNTAVLFLAWGDPAAEFAGQRWGRVGQVKTLAGSLGCLGACLVAGLVGVGLGGLSPWAALAGAVVATLVERWPPPPDDNVWMPILSGLTMALVQSIVGGQTVLFPMWC
jgi:dolichol kinase